MARLPRIIRLVHTVPGRTRLRLQWLRSADGEAAALADHLSRLAGMTEVAIRPWTGSVLCQYDADRLDADRIVAAVQRHSGVKVVARPGEETPEERAEYLRILRAEDRSLARAMTESFRSVDDSVLAATEGRLDLGILASLGFLAAGALEIATTRRLPAPPWFNLGWWAFRTFTMFEGATVPARSPAPPPRFRLAMAGGQASPRIRRPAPRRGRRPKKAGS